MSNALRKPMTLYEFDGFQPVAMTGGTYAHDAVTMNLAASPVSAARRAARTAGTSSC